MKLTAFRVQNYKKIRDTGWITVRDLTAFVGKNEAGKSALFRGLSKLNPSDGEKYDGLKEFPRRRYTDEFKQQDWPVTSGRFELSEEDRQTLTEICPELKGCPHVVCTRHYSWELQVDFEPALSATPLRRSEFVRVLEDVEQAILELSAPEGKGDALSAIKENLLNSISQLKNQQTSKPHEEIVPLAEAEQLRNTIATQSNEDWQKKILEPLRQQAEKAVERSRFASQLEEAREWVKNNLPKFIYFDRYDVIDSAVHLPSFVQQLHSNPSAPRVRTTRCLFEHVGLDIEHLAALGRHQDGQNPDEQVRRYVDERAIHFSSASNAMTIKFQDWWEQRRHKFRYQADGDYFRIWVSDDLDPSEIELDQRSLGMQYFFSFYTVFLVEAKDAHQGSILLLDEPGLHMHGTAQAKVVKFLERLSKDNQTMYTTHSPFMVDADHLERVRIVYEAEDGTTNVSEDVWPRDKDALFPLQAGLGYQLVQSLFISKRQLIVEGLTDYWILKAFDQALQQRKKPSLREDVVIVPSAGVSKLLPLASMLIGHDVEIVALLDGDEPGRKEGKKLVDKLLSGDAGRCLFIGDFLKDKPNAELEDIFPEDVYLEAVKEAYSIHNLKFGKKEQPVEGVVNKVKALFERRGLGQFEKWRPAAVLRDWIMENPEKIPSEVFGLVEEVFKQVNEAFSSSSADPRALGYEK
ncbi:MAG: AAA family ATPase [Deltaproteobacteria bacterium]|nr:AAA family ATPase [Deltaproteobacteria bacterium]